MTRLTMEVCYLYGDQSLCKEAMQRYLRNDGHPKKAYKLNLTGGGTRHS